MANKRPTESDLKAMGLVYDNSTGMWVKRQVSIATVNPIQKIEYTKLQSSEVDNKELIAIMPKGRPNLEKEQLKIHRQIPISLIIDKVKKELGISHIVIMGLIPGLNSSHGLMQAHWTTVKKQKELYCSYINNNLVSGHAKKHEGKVIIEYIGYKSRLMDWDNFCASFKHIGDSLVKCGIIKDDSPEVVLKFIPSQIKIKQKDQRVDIIIKDVL